MKEVGMGKTRAKVQIKARAESLGKSTNAYIVDLTNEDMKKE